MDETDVTREIADIHRQLTGLEAETARLASRLAALERSRLEAMSHLPPQVDATASITVTATSPPAGPLPSPLGERSDQAVRLCSGLCERVGEGAMRQAAREVRPVSEPGLPSRVGRSHRAASLTAERDPRGEAGSGFVMGVYPLLPDETCGFLAVDFDGAPWADDARAFVETCRAEGVPADSSARGRAKEGMSGSFLRRQFRPATRGGSAHGW